MKLFLGGDVMLGRGVDQIMKYKGDPELKESFIKDARYYVPDEMKKFTQPGNFVLDNYIWNDLLKDPNFLESDLKIVNLETSVTESDEYDLQKEIHYKMHPKNVPVLKYVDFCSIANNHIMDFGRTGLLETLNSLTVPYAGAGRNLAEAARPKLVNGIKIFCAATHYAGLPKNWRATDEPGVNLILDEFDFLAFLNRIRKEKSNEFIVVSIHWGSNWGYTVESKHRKWAQRLIDSGVDLVHGHSSHHFKPMEIYKGKLILYGCGDLINDYEIIPRREKYMDDINLAYYPTYENGVLTKLEIVPYTLKNLQLKRVYDLDRIVERLNLICQPFNLSYRQVDGVIEGQLFSLT